MKRNKKIVKADDNQYNSKLLAITVVQLDMFNNCVRVLLKTSEGVTSISISPEELVKLLTRAAHIVIDEYDSIYGATLRKMKKLLIHEQLEEPPE